MNISDKIDKYFNKNADSKIKKEIKQHAVRHIKKFYSKRTEGYKIISAYYEFKRDKDNIFTDSYIRYISHIGYLMLKKEINRRNDVVERYLY